MWTISELKSRARAGLKNYYWMAILLNVIIGFMGLLIIGLSSLARIIPFVGLFVVFFVSMILNNVLSIGVWSYYVKSEQMGSDAGIGEIFSGIRNIGLVAEISLFYWLWSLVPIMNIIKSYELYMVFSLAIEFPEKTRKEIFEMSKEMMDGNKMNTFILELSFIGWFFLGIITCCIGMLFVVPYFMATKAELYLWLKEERLGTMIVPKSVFESNKSVAELPANGYLVGTQGEFTGANIPIKIGEVLKIGRDPAQCNLVIKGMQTSRLHVIVEFDGHLFQVTDQSSQGTFNLRGGQLPHGRSVALPSGTYLQIGNGGDIFMLECR